jgi:hypothetical protein
MMPNNTLSATPEPAPFLPPRQTVRFSAAAGTSDVHFGGIAVGDPSQGISYQLWSAFTDGSSVWLEAPNTPAFVLLPSVGAVWVALAFDQNARVFVAYVTSTGAAFYYWYDSTIPGYRTSALSGPLQSVFAALDDSRPALSSSSDVLLAYVRAGVLYYRQQRDRFGIEYDLGAVPASLVQIGMNHADRFQFAFQNVQGNNVLPPAEWAAQTMNGQPL